VNGRELYVYYRVRDSASAQAHAQVMHLHAELLASWPQLKMRLLRRPEASDGLQTWMEVYAVDPADPQMGIDGVLEAEIEAAAMRCLTLIEGARHVEVFMPLSAEPSAPA
jgi:hypothetical protein